MQYTSIVFNVIVLISLISCNPRERRIKDQWKFCYVTPTPKGYVEGMPLIEGTDEPLSKSAQEDYDFIFSNKSREMFMESEDGTMKKVKLEDYSTFRGRKGLPPNTDYRYSDKKKKGTVFYDKKSSKSKHAFLDKFSDESLNVTSDDYPSIEVSQFTEKEESDSPDVDPKYKDSTDTEYSAKIPSDSGFTEVDYSVVEDYSGKRHTNKDYTGEISSPESYYDKDDQSSSESKTSKQKKRKRIIDKKIGKKKKKMKEKLQALEARNERARKKELIRDRQSGRLKTGGKEKRGKDRGGRGGGDRDMSRKGKGGRDRGGRDGGGRGGGGRGGGGGARGGRGGGGRGGGSRGKKEKVRGFEERDAGGYGDRYKSSESDKSSDSDRSYSRRSPSNKRKDFKKMKDKNRGGGRYGRTRIRKRGYRASGVYSDRDFAKGRRDKAKNAFDLKKKAEKKRLRKAKMRRRRTRMRNEKRKISKFVKRSSEFDKKNKRRRRFG